MAYSRIAAIGKLIVNNQNIDNSTVIFTLDNEILFTGDVEIVNSANSNTTIVTLPSNFPRPSKLLYFICAFTTSTNTETFKTCKLHTDGTITINSIGYGTLRLNGVCINLNNNFYNDTIGNNDESIMTSPISYG